MNAIQKLHTMRRRSERINCPEHGEHDVDTWGGKAECPVCMERAAELREADRRARHAQERVQERHAELALPRRFKQADLATHPCSSDKQRAAVAACQAFVDSLPNEGQGLFLIGPPGTGKTTLAAAMCRAAIDQRGRTARLVTQRELIRSIRATWQKGAEATESQVIDEYALPGLLVIDDAGVGHGSDSELVSLLDVVDGRYQRQRPTVTCSNLTLPALAKAVGDRVFDRLREGARFVVCDWPSHRGGTAA